MKEIRGGHPVDTGGMSWPRPMTKFDIALHGDPGVPVDQWAVACPGCGRGGAFWLSPYSASLACRWCPYVLEQGAIELGPRERFEYLRPHPKADPFLYITRYADARSAS